MRWTGSVCGWRFMCGAVSCELGCHFTGSVPLLMRRPSSERGRGRLRILSWLETSKEATGGHPRGARTLVTEGFELRRQAVELARLREKPTAQMATGPRHRRVRSAVLNEAD